MNHKAFRKSLITVGLVVGLVLLLLTMGGCGAKPGRRDGGCGGAAKKGSRPSGGGSSRMPVLP